MANVIHGDISLFNWMINQCFKYEKDQSPSSLRTLATKIFSCYFTPETRNSAIAKAVAKRDKTIIVHSRQPANKIGTTEHIESSGMLIDYDFMQSKDKLSNQTLVRKCPYIIIAHVSYYYFHREHCPLCQSSLFGCPTQRSFTHCAAHDLEALLSTIITVCNYTTGPGGQLRTPVKGDEDIPINSWFTKEKIRELACNKSIHLEGFDQTILPFLPPYWEDFAPYLQRLIDATWDAKPFLTQPNTASHQAYRTILSDAISMYQRTEQALPAHYAVTPIAKHPREPSSHASNKRQYTETNDNHQPQDQHDFIPHYLESYDKSSDITFTLAT